MAVGDTGVRTGDVWVSDYDVGLATHLGGVERQVPDPVFKGSGTPPTVPYYTIAVPGVRGHARFGGHTPIVWGNARDVLNPAVLPCMVIVRQSDMDADTPRWVGYDHAYRRPTDAALAAGVITAKTGRQGYSEYEYRAGPRAYNFKYSVWLRAENYLDVDAMAKFFWKRVPERGCAIEVVDSTGVKRQYDILRESFGLGSSNEGVMADRPYSRFDVVVYGELEYDVAQTAKAATSFVTTVKGK